MTQPISNPAGRTVLVLPSAEKAAEKAAQLFAQIAADAIEQRGRFSVALAGGNTPKPMYASLADGSRFGEIRWPKVHVFFTDERCVPGDDEASNYRMVNEALLSHVNVCPNCVHRIQGELTSVPAADLYEQELRDHFVEAGDQFDLVVLGLGGDGHTASLFPGTEAIGIDDVWCFGNEVPAIDDERVTLTYPILNAARRVIFLVIGGSKAAAVRATLTEPVDKSTRPAQGVQPTDGEVTWVLDVAAAGELPDGTVTKCD